jgi:hypothetical protein
MKVNGSGSLNSQILKWQEDIKVKEAQNGLIPKNTKLARRYESEHEAQNGLIPKKY